MLETLCFPLPRPAPSLVGDILHAVWYSQKKRKSADRLIVVPQSSAFGQLRSLIRRALGDVN